MVFTIFAFDFSLVCTFLHHILHGVNLCKSNFSCRVTKVCELHLLSILLINGSKITGSGDERSLTRVN